MIIDGIDNNKVMVCPHQFYDCKYHRSYGDGAVFICGFEDCIKLKRCFKDENSVSST